MFFFLGSGAKNSKKKKNNNDPLLGKARELFIDGKFPIVTTDSFIGKQVAKVLGLVCCRGYDSEEAFFGMASRALAKGAHAIVGYTENIAFHPDGSRYFSCYGTAVMFVWEADEKYGAAIMGRKGLEFFNEKQLGQIPAVQTALTVKNTHNTSEVSPDSIG